MVTRFDVGAFWPHPPAHVLGALLVVALTFFVTYLRTRREYQKWVQNANGRPVPPPRLPYTIPWLGSALSMLSRIPGQFWDHLAAHHANKAGAITVLLGGERMHVLFSPVALQALFKARHVTRHVQTVKALVSGFGMEQAECERYFDVEGKGTEEKGGKRIDRMAQQEHIMVNYLFKHEAACGLTMDFERLLVDELKEYSSQLPSDGTEVNLCDWIKTMMGRASTKAFMGTEIFEAYPSMLEDFLEFDDIIMTLFFDIPRFMAPGPYRIREKLLQGLQDWHNHIDVHTTDILPPDSPQRWDLKLGARCLRARHIMYKEVHLNPRSKAAQDLGFFFALSSNSIPTAAYMLMHILDPNADPWLLRRVQTELNSSWQPDKTALDIEKLSSQPLLQSIFYEVLRLYMDFMITRHCDEDTVLPTTDTSAQNPLLFPKGTTILSPTWLAHHSPTYHSAPSTFDPERYLLPSPSNSNEPMFSLANTGGKLHPFGGGKTICPGRTFAKQEVFCLLAWVFREFEVESKEFVDGEGEARKEFPVLAKQLTGTGILGLEGDLRVRVRVKGGEGRG